jgi:hypothetical protein
MEDIRIGRQAGGELLIVNALNTSFLLADADPKRIAITFYPPPSGVLTIAVKSPAVANAGIVLASGDHPVTLDLLNGGSLLKTPFYAIHSAGGVKVTCNVTQLLLE